MRRSERALELLGVVRQLGASGLTRATSGNASVRLADGLLITPTGVPYEAMGPDDLVDIALDGTVRHAPRGRAPSTEWRLHAAVLARRPDVSAVVHTHPPAATALACLREDLPSFHYMVAAAGGSTIRCAAYATFGTAELAANAVTALEERRACLLANHGLVTCGASAAAALALAVEVEALADQYLRARAVGRPVLLDDPEMRRVLERFETYGTDTSSAAS